MSRDEGEQPHQGTELAARGAAEWCLCPLGRDFVLGITPQTIASHTEGRARLQQFTHQAVQVPVN